MYDILGEISTDNRLLVIAAFRVMSVLHCDQMNIKYFQKYTLNNQAVFVS